MTRTRLIVPVLLALAALVLAPSLALGAPRWLAPVDLTPAGESASSPRVVVGPGGVATMAWVAHTPAGPVVRVSRRPAGSGTWGTPVVVSGPGAGAVTGLAVDATGAAAVLWTVPVPGDPTSVVLFASVRTGSAGFGPAEAIQGPPASFHFNALGSDGAGAFVVAFSAATAPGTGSTAFASTRPVGGPWGAAEVLSAPDDHALVTEVAGSGGRVAVAWTAGPVGSLQRTVRVRERPAAGQQWAEERTVSAVDARTSEPSIAMGAGGRAIVAWFASTAEGSEVQSTFRPAADGAWTAPEALGPGGGITPRPRALLEPDGTATVVWTAPEEGGVTARVRPAGKGFGAAQQLGASGAPVSPFSGGLGAAGPAGGAIAVWVSGSLDGVRVVRAAVKPAGDAPFNQAATISPPEAALVGETAALGPTGDGVAAWVRGTAAVGSAGILRSADFTERPGSTLTPSPIALRIDRAPRTAVEGTLVRLKLAVEGFAEGLVVRLQQHQRGAYRDTGQTVTLNGTAGEFPLRLTFPGKGVFRLAYEDRGAAAFSRGITIQISRGTLRRPLVPAGMLPKAIGVGFGAVWVLTTGQDGQDVVLRLDARNGEPAGAPVPVGDGVGLVVGSEAVWVSRGPQADRGVVRLDPRDGSIVSEVPVITTGAIGAGEAGVWTVECERSLDPGIPCTEQRVARIEPATNAVAQRFSVVQARDEVASVGGIAVGRRYVWFTRSADKSRVAIRIDPRSGRIVPIGSGIALAAAGNEVVGLLGPRSCRLVGATGATELTGRRTIAGGPRYDCSALVREGADLWVVQDANTAGIDPADARLNSRLVRLDAATLRPKGRPVTIGLSPLSVDVGEGAIWAASGEEAVARRIDLRDVGSGTASPRPPKPPRLRAPWRRPVGLPGSRGTGAVGLDLATGPERARRRDLAGRARPRQRGRDGDPALRRAAVGARPSHGTRTGRRLLGRSAGGDERRRRGRGGLDAQRRLLLGVHRAGRAARPAGRRLVGAGDARRPRHRELRAGRGHRRRRRGRGGLVLPVRRRPGPDEGPGRDEAARRRLRRARCGSTRARPPPSRPRASPSRPPARRSPPGAPSPAAGSPRSRARRPAPSAGPPRWPRRRSRAAACGSRSTTPARPWRSGFAMASTPRAAVRTGRGARPSGSPRPAGTR